MTRIGALGDVVVRWGLVALLVITPLAFGTVEPWAIVLMEWGIWTLAIVEWMRRSLLRAPNVPPRGPRIGLEIPCALFTVFCLLQTVPLPSGWVARLSPGAARMYETVDLQAFSPVAIPSDAAADPLLHLGASPRRTVSINPEQTRERVLLFVSFAALFFTTVSWIQDARRAVFLLFAVSGVGVAVALFALIQHFTWNGKIYWLRDAPSASSLGPFVNRNHFAGYIGMIVPIAVAFAFHAAREGRRGAQASEAVSERWGRSGLAAFAAAVLVVSLFLSLSRGGILSSLLSGALLFLIVSRRLASRAVTWGVAALILVLILAFFFLIGADVIQAQIGTFRGLGNEASFRFRAVVWRAALQNLREYLWFGSGLGTFEESFARFTPPGSARRWDRAHNDYLQLAWETGLAGFLIFAAAAATFISRYWLPALRRRRDPMDLFRVAVAVAILSIAMHSFVDFNLQIGSNGFLFTLLCGVTVALTRLVPNADGTTSAGAALRPAE